MPEPTDPTESRPTHLDTTAKAAASTKADEGPFGEAGAALYDERWKPLAALRDNLDLQTALVFRALPADSHCLCVGGGTGAELLALARYFPGWRFTVVEPAPAMLAICRRHAEEAGITPRCEFHAGYTATLDPAARFDAATAILVSQFITVTDERRRFYADIARRLKSTGLLVTADLILPPTQQRAQLFEVWGRMMVHAGTPAKEVESKLRVLQEQVALVEDA